MTNKELFNRETYEQLDAEQNSEDLEVFEAIDEAPSEESVGRRLNYHYKIDRFLNNGILIVGVLLLAVLLIAFFV